MRRAIAVVHQDDHLPAAQRTGRDGETSRSVRCGDQVVCRSRSVERSRGAAIPVPAHSEKAVRSPGDEVSEVGADSNPATERDNCRRAPRSSPLTQRDLKRPSVGGVQPRVRRVLERGGSQPGRVGNAPGSDTRHRPGGLDEDVRVDGNRLARFSRKHRPVRCERHGHGAGAFTRRGPGRQYGSDADPERSNGSNPRLSLATDVPFRALTAEAASDSPTRRLSRSTPPPREPWHPSASRQRSAIQPVAHRSSTRMAPR